jgi:hypothetical protein
MGKHSGGKQMHYAQVGKRGIRQDETMPEFLQQVLQRQSSRMQTTQPLPKIDPYDNWLAEGRWPRGWTR